MVKTKTATTLTLESLDFSHYIAISQSFIVNLKCDHPFLCEFPILFSTVKLK